MRVTGSLLGLGSPDGSTKVQLGFYFFLLGADQDGSGARD